MVGNGGELATHAPGIATITTTTVTTIATAITTTVITPVASIATVTAGALLARPHSRTSGGGLGATTSGSITTAAAATTRGDGVARWPAHRWQGAVGRGAPLRRPLCRRCLPRLPPRHHHRRHHPEVRMVR